MSVVLHGYRYSVYLRIVRMALLEKGVSWTHAEVDPFAEIVAAGYLALNPFGRVPTLVHDGFVLYETAAITRYVDEAFDGPSLQPGHPRDRARMTQVIAIIDSYGYWPMVRQVFSPRVFNAALGRVADEAVITSGLEQSHRVLRALDGLVGGGRFVAGDRLSLADLHLAAMFAYFGAAPEGDAAIASYPRVGAWWRENRHLGSLLATDPGLPSPGD